MSTPPATAKRRRRAYAQGEAADHPPRPDPLERRFEQGDKGALLYAIYLCAFAHHPLPSWAAIAFSHEYQKVKYNYLHTSWDEVFGTPHPKHVKIPAKRARLEKQWRVWIRVVEERKKTPGRDVFPRVADDFKISVGTAREYFYAANRRYHSADPKQAQLARDVVWENVLRLTMLDLASRLPGGRGYSMDVLMEPALERMKRLITLEST